MRPGHELPESTLETAQLFEKWVSQRSPQAQSLWAKSGDDTGHLSVPQHLVDAACSAAAVFDVWVADNIKREIAGHLGITVEELRTFYIWLAGAHDVGKITRAFQTQLQDRAGYEHIINSIVDTGLDLEKDELPKMPHGRSSGVILRRWLEAQGMPRTMATWVGSIGDAHHGVASTGDEKSAIEAVLEEYPAAWLSVQDEIVSAMTTTLHAQPVLDKIGKIEDPEAGVAQFLTGLVVIADWIASNAEAFPMVVDKGQVERLRSGMAQTDLTAPWHPVKPISDIDELYRASFAWPQHFNARNVQRALAEAARRATRPTLFILEAETGVGKTEAALAAAHIIADQTGAQGIYFAAPTMATANGLLERTIDWARNTSGVGAVTSLYLAHSKNQLSRAAMSLPRGIAEDETSNRGDVIASSWMRGRRRGLLSNIVVGTIDQVLMMSLMQRFSMLRHAALAGKVIIFDEVHAYDAYTSEYLETTLEWLAYYGASVIMMSATLPAQRRASLVEAYTGVAPEEAPHGYPLITVADESATTYITPPPNPTNMVATIEHIDDSLDTLRGTLDNLLIDGGCALIICNTIARAQDAYRELKTQYADDIELHHAGFVAWERSQKEDELREQLGPHARRGAGRPYRKVVVATQVAEQSLDIDADVLITDIAPMDLVVQRAGRLQRHSRPVDDRPPQLQDPKIFIRGVLSPLPTPEFDGGAKAIYDPQILLSTLLHLPTTFRRPDDIEALVQSTYDLDTTVVPDEIQQIWDEAAGVSQLRQHNARERSKSFRTPSPFCSTRLNEFFKDSKAVLNLDREEAGAAQVRDAEPTVEVIPIIETDYGYRLWGVDKEVLADAEPDYQTAFQLASSTVRLPARLTRYESDFNIVMDALEENTPVTWSKHYLLNGQLALPLDEDGETRIGRFLVRYSSELGIEVSFERGE